MITQHVGEELRELLVKLGVNFTEVGPGRKHVFDAYLQGRLVSLLALGLSLRQAGAALGVSHTAVSNELRRCGELRERIAAARFQAQIEPLLVILRESRRSWRAATWLVNYLSKQIALQEETPDERRARLEADRKEAAREQAQAARAKELEARIETQLDYGGPTKSANVPPMPSGPLAKPRSAPSTACRRRSNEEIVSRQTTTERHGGRSLTARGQATE